MSIELFIIKIVNVLRRLSMNIYNLRYFVTLARIRQYTKAAEELCITQPSLSHAISQMEKELGVRLFEKSLYCSSACSNKNALTASLISSGFPSIISLPHKV